MNSTPQAPPPPILSTHLGITNTSGAWITPAFQLHVSRLDEMRGRGRGAAAAQVAGLRLPALLAERRALAAREAGGFGLLVVC